MNFSITRIFTDEQGESRFEDVEIPMTSGGPIGFLSEAEDVEHLIFREVAPDYDFSFHNAPARQYILLLDGEIEIETSLGECRRFKGGDVLLVEDTTGKGHKTRNLLNQPRRSVFVTRSEGTGTGNRG
jgi:hypothetical protein